MAAAPAAAAEAANERARAAEERLEAAAARLPQAVTLEGEPALVSLWLLHPPRERLDDLQLTRVAIT